MRNLLKKISLFSAALLCSGVIICSVSAPAWAATSDCTSILPSSWCNDENSVTNIIKAVIAIMSGGIGVLAILGLVICGFIWMTARDNEAQVTMAKKRMLDIVIGLGIWALLAAGTSLVLNLITPGADNTKSEIDKVSVMMIGGENA